MKANIHQQLGMKIFYSLSMARPLRDPNGDIRVDRRGIQMTDESTRRFGGFVEAPPTVPHIPNIVLTAGRNEMGTRSGWVEYCQVGSGSTDPLPSETALEGWVAGSNTLVSSVDGVTGVTPYYGWYRPTIRFASGTVSTNLNEVGIGWGASGSTLISRAKLVDIFGDPTTITPVGDEILDVTAEIRYYAPLGDVLGTITLNGLVYDTITRAASASSTTAWTDYIGSEVEGLGSIVVYDGNIGTVVQTPSGSSAVLDASPTTLIYGNNNLYRDIQASGASGNGNLGAGIRSAVVSAKGCSFQTRFGRQGGGDETVPKTAAESMSLTWRISWAAYWFEAAWTMQAAHDSTTPTTGNWNTNVAKTLLRINWDDDSSDDYQLDLRVPIGTTFHVYEGDGVWVKYTTTGAYSEGTDWTDYAVTGVESGGGPIVSTTQTIRLLTE